MPKNGDLDPLLKSDPLQRWLQDIESQEPEPLVVLLLPLVSSKIKNKVVAASVSDCGKQDRKSMEPSQ